MSGRHIELIDGILLLKIWSGSQTDNAGGPIAFKQSEKVKS